MDLCVVDWAIIKDILVALIGAGIPSLVAFYIFYKWKYQKGSEVVADEAKQTIKDLLEIINISYQMNSYSASSESNAKKFKDFEILSEKILRSSLFIDECIMIDNLKLELDKFNKLCWEVKDVGLEYDPVKNHKEFKDKLSGKVGYIGSTGIELVNILIPYSTYQKEFVFKHKN